jgi:molybdopterin-guanine dinucleotide biosynthesis protein A
LLTGIVLAGGRSLRYGRNKALELFKGKRLIDRALEDLGAFCAPVLVIANDLEAYRGIRATLVQDIVPHQGPLGGIYTALLFSPGDWIFVKATDMPFLVPELAAMMCEARDESCDVVVPVRNGFYEPLLALYHRRCIPSVAEAIEREERQIVRFYKKVKVKELAESEWRSVDPDALSFRNVNTPEDMELLEWN